MPREHTPLPWQVIAALLLGHGWLLASTTWRRRQQEPGAGPAWTLFDERRELLDGNILSSVERVSFQAILDNTAEPVLYRQALGELSKYLHRASGERVVILIDEYDQPIHAGYVHGYFQEIIEFFRAFLTVGLKDNPHIERGVVTGILRIARAL